MKQIADAPASLAMTGRGANAVIPSERSERMGSVRICINGGE